MQKGWCWWCAANACSWITEIFVFYRTNCRHLFASIQFSNTMTTICEILDLMKSRFRIRVSFVSLFLCLVSFFRFCTTSQSCCIASNRRRRLATTPCRRRRLQSHAQILDIPIIHCRRMFPPLFAFSSFLPLWRSPLSLLPLSLPLGKGVLTELQASVFVSEWMCVC